MPHIFGSSLSARRTSRAQSFPSRDSLIPSRIAALMTKYSTHAPIRNPISSTAAVKIAMRVISVCSASMASSFVARGV